MEIFKTLSELSTKTTRANYLLHVKTQLKIVTEKLKEAGYTIRRNYEITAPETVIYEYTEDVIYLNQMRFVFNGLMYNRWPEDPEHTLLFIGLRGFVENQYDSLPDE